MTRLSIGSWAFGAYSENPSPLELVLDRVAGFGFDGIELGAFDPHPTPATCKSPAERQSLRAMIEDRGLAISAVAAGFEGASFLRQDDASLYSGLLERNLEFCSELGATRLIVHTVDPPELPSEVGEDLAYERLIRTWEDGIQRAADFKITLAWEFEPCWAFNQPDQIARIATTLAGPNFGVLYDTAHAHMVAEVGARQAGKLQSTIDGQVNLLDQLAGTIAHVHLLDSDGTLHEGESSSARTTVHVPFGQGDVEFDRVIPALAAAGGLSDWWTVDLCFWPDPWGAAEESRRYVAELLEGVK